MSDVPIEIPAWNGRAQPAGEVWRLRKGKKEALCTLWSHQMGGEARVTVGPELWRTDTRIDTAELMTLAFEWKWQFQEKGWKPLQ